MNTWIAAALIGVFVALGLWHVGMAFGLGSSTGAAVPSVEGKPLFVPSRKATLAVALVLFGFAALLAFTAGVVSAGMPQPPMTWSCYALALGLTARAVGDFKYVGFFKRIGGSRFARMDSLVYSPLCFALALGVAYVAFASSRIAT